MNRILHYSLLLLTLWFSRSYAADYYWIGGSGAWTNVLNWATTSGGGINPAVLPGPSDDVYFDSNSFSFPGQLVSVTGAVSCRSLTVAGLSSKVPGFLGGSIQVHGSVTLLEGLQMNTTLVLAGTQSGLFFRSNGAVLDSFVVNRANSTTQIDDSLHCKLLLHINGSVDARGKKIRAVSMKNANNISGSILDLSDAFVEVDSFLMSTNLWFSIQLQGSSFRVHKGIFACGFLHFHRIEIVDTATIGSELSNACAGLGFSGFKIDSLFVSDFGLLTMRSNENDKGPVEIDFLLGGEKAKLLLSRPIHVHTFEWDGFVDVQNDYIEVEVLLLNENTTFRIVPSVSMQSPGIKVRQQWEIRGTCAKRVLFYSSEPGRSVFVESSATLQFSYADLVDIRLVGGGPQDMTQSSVAGTSSGFTGMQSKGRTYYWINDSGEWYDGAHWSFTDGGNASFCVPGILDTVVFSNLSFSAAQQIVDYRSDRDLVVKHINCTNNNFPFEWETNATNVIVLGSAFIRQNAQFVSQTGFRFLGAGTGFFNIRGEQAITYIKPQGYTNFQVLVTDSLVSPECEVEVRGMTFAASGNFWQLKSLNVDACQTLFALNELHLDSIQSGGEDNVFSATQTVIHAKEKAIFKDAIVSLLSLRYYGKETCLIERYQRLDSLFLFQPCSFFTYNDTVSGPPLAPIATFFANQSGEPGFTRVKGVFVSEGTTLGDVDFRNCEFDRLRMFQTGLFYLSGDLKINRFFSNTGNCGRQSYFMKNPDSLGVYFFLNSNADSLVFSHFHIYGIDAIGSADFIARDCKDMGLNSGWKFSGAKGRTYYWIGKTGNFTQAANWSETSNGSPSFCLPGALDTVVFDKFSFISNADTVFFPSKFPVTVRSFIVKDSIVGRPVFWSQGHLLINVLKDFKLLAPTEWPVPSRVSFYVNKDTGFINCRFNQANLTLSMGHPGTITRYMLEDTLRVGSLWMGFGTFFARSFPIYAHTFIADYAPGYPVGEVTGKSNLTHTYLEIDSISVYQEFTRPNFMRGRADMTGTRVKCRKFLMSFVAGETPLSVSFYPEEKGFFAIGESGLQGGRVDSLIAPGGLRLYQAEESSPPGVIFMDYLEVDSVYESFVPTNIAYAEVRANAHFKMFHDFGDVFFYKNRKYEFDPMTQVSYQYMGASASSCEPITIIGKQAGKQFTLLKKQAAVFDGQGVRMRDCISGGGVSYMGPQSVSLGNNKDWIIGRDPSYNLVDLSQDFELCENDSIYISARTLYPNAKEYLWKIDGQAFFPGEFGFFLGKSGFYTLEAKYTDDCSLFDSARVSIFSRDLLNLGNDTTLCQGGFVQLRPTLEPGMSYTWSTGSRQPGIVVTRSGIYWLKVTNPKGCTISDSVFIGFVTKPVNPAGKDTVVCADLNYITGVEHKNYWYQWSNGDTTAKIPVGQGGVFTLRMGNGICYVEDTVSVQVDNPVPFSLGNDTVMLTGQSLALRANEILPNYKWNTGASTPSIFVETDGFYWLRTESGVCKTADTIWVRFRPPLTVRFNQDSLLICEGDSVNLRPLTNKPVNRYFWNTQSTDSILLGVTDKGWYKVEVNDSFFKAVDSIFVSVQPKLAFTIGKDTLLCDGDTLQLTPSLAADTYKWSDGSTNPHFKVTSMGNYSVEISKGVCKASDSIEVAYEQYPSLDFQSDTLLCEGGVIEISLPNKYRYQWNDGDTSMQKIVTQTGVYSLEAKLGPCISNYSFTANFQSFPPFDLGADTVLCQSASLELDATRSFATQYQWNDGLLFAKRLVSSTGVYTVTLSDGICTTSDSIRVVFSELPYVSLGEDKAICNGEFPELIAEVKESGLKFSWNTGSTSDRITAFDTGTYHVIVSNAYCEATDTVRVLPCDCDIVYVPTAFSPNNDGLNDVFKPEECYMGYYKMEVYNRWGQKVFESSERENGWDGTHKGIAAAQGVYLYKITFDALYGTGGVKKRYNLTGSVLLIR